jgi:molybdopterin-guanine dinucleotide biosynthesis protein A
VLKIKVDSNYLAIAILIGGQSTRFGSDKGLFEFHGKPLISYQLETLNKFDYNIFLVRSSKEQIQKYIDKIDIRLITGFIIDETTIIPNQDLRVPVIGLYSAFKELKKLNYEKLLALPCDNPLIQYNVVNFLIEQSNGYDCCIPQWKNGFTEPLFAIYSIKKAIKRLKLNIQKKDLKLTNLVDENWNINFLSVENSIAKLDKDLHSFLNINSLKDVKKLVKIYQKDY